MKKGKGGTSGGERARLVENDLDASHNWTVRSHRTSAEGKREILGFLTSEQRSALASNSLVVVKIGKLLMYVTLSVF